MSNDKFRGSFVSLDFFASDDRKGEECTLGQCKRKEHELKLKLKLKLKKTPRYLGMTVCKYIVKRILNDVGNLEFRT